MQSCSVLCILCFAVCTAVHLVYYLANHNSINQWTKYYTFTSYECLSSQPCLICIVFICPNCINHIKSRFFICMCKTFNFTLLNRRHTFTMPDTNLFEVIELEKIENGGVRIGPEVHVGSVDVIKSHSTFICFKCNRKVRIFQIS